MAIKVKHGDWGPLMTRDVEFYFVCDTCGERINGTDGIVNTCDDGTVRHVHRPPRPCDDHGSGWMEINDFISALSKTQLQMERG